MRQILWCPEQWNLSLIKYLHLSLEEFWYIMETERGCQEWGVVSWGRILKEKNHSWHTTASKLTGLESFLGALTSFKPCAAMLVWKPQREGNHRLAKQQAVVFSSGFILETWNHRTLWADWREKVSPLEAPGGREDTCAAAAKPHGLHCPQLWGKPTREGLQPGVPDCEAPLLIRGAIYTILFKNCTGIVLLLPGLRMLHVGAAVCFPGPLT